MCSMIHTPVGYQRCQRPGAPGKMQGISDMHLIILRYNSFLKSCSEYCQTININHE